MVGKINCKWDDKFWRKIEQDSRDLDGTTIEYGFPEEIMHPEAKVPVAAVAEWNNNGVRGKDGSFRIPPRDFMFLADIYSQGDMHKFNEQVFLTLGLGKGKVDKSLDYISKELADLCRQAITEGDFKVLAPSTVAQKGHDTILIETGFMLDSIKGKVIR